MDVLSRSMKAQRDATVAMRKTGWSVPDTVYFTLRRRPGRSDVSCITALFETDPPEGCLLVRSISSLKLGRMSPESIEQLAHFWAKEMPA